MDLTRRLDTSSSWTLVRDIECLLGTIDAYGRFATFECETESRGLRYVQAILSSGGWMYVESVSDEFILDVDHRLWPEEIASLVRLGFVAPEPGGSPNWQAALGPDLRGRVAIAAELAMKTFVDVHGWTPGDEIQVETGLCVCDEVPDDLTA